MINCTWKQGFSGKTYKYIESYTEEEKQRWEMMRIKVFQITFHHSLFCSWDTRNMHNFHKHLVLRRVTWILGYSIHRRVHKSM